MRASCFLASTKCPVLAHMSSGEDSHIESKPPSQETSAMKHTPAHIAIQAPEYKAVKQVIAVNLVAHGWTAASQLDMDICCLVASQDYETAVGIKTATLSLEPRSEGFQLVGNYQSEGNNVLSTTWLNIPSGMTSEQIAEKVPEFLEKVGREVNRSYARRLFLL